MLSPDVRAVAMDLLRPPSQYGLDLAVLTTYTLDLDALLALPLAVLSQSDSSVEDLMAYPLDLIAALREAGDRIHVFVDETGIGIPDRGRELVSTLESSVHPVRAPNGGVFHPKVWLARFVPEDDDAPELLRLAILSRNLTFDCSWDIALASEAPIGGRRVADSRPLGELIAALPSMAAKAGTRLPKSVSDAVATLAEKARRTAYPAPEGFDSPLRFHSFGFPSRPTGVWPPKGDASRVLAVAPFAGKYGTDMTAAFAGDGAKCTLVGRAEELDQISPDALDKWSEVLVLSDPASGESAEEARRPSGLHAKIIGVEHGGQATWYFGSANLTRAALAGRNVEILARLTGRRHRCGIGQFLDEHPVGTGGRVAHAQADRKRRFRDLCEPYNPSPTETEEDDATLAEEERQRSRGMLEKAQAAVTQSVASGDLRVVCRPGEDVWEWRMVGEIGDMPDGVTVHIWPATLAEEHCHPPNHLSWQLPVSHLTAFVAFWMSVGVEGVDDLRFAMRLPDEGLPNDRTARILRALVDSPAKFLHFLRALLGPIGERDFLPRDGEGPAVPYGEGVFGGAETLLEDLLRAASRDPERLDVVRRLVDDLRRTEDGRAIILPDLYELWQAIDETVATR